MVVKLLLRLSLDPLRICFLIACDHWQMWQSKVLAFVCWTSIILLTSLGAASSGATTQMGLSDGGDAMEITICMVPVVVTGGFFLYRAWCVQESVMMNDESQSLRQPTQGVRAAAHQRHDYY
jgi:hypothetical protein